VEKQGDLKGSKNATRKKRNGKRGGAFSRKNRQTLWVEGQRTSAVCESQGGGRGKIQTTLIQPVTGTYGEAKAYVGKI